MNYQKLIETALDRISWAFSSPSAGLLASGSRGSCRSKL